MEITIKTLTKHIYDYVPMGTKRTTCDYNLFHTTFGLSKTGTYVMTDEPNSEMRRFLERETWAFGPRITELSEFATLNGGEDCFMKYVANRSPDFHLDSLCQWLRGYNQDDWLCDEDYPSKDDNLHDYPLIKDYLVHVEKMALQTAIPKSRPTKRTTHKI